MRLFDDFEREVEKRTACKGLRTQLEQARAASEVRASNSVWLPPGGPGDFDIDDRVEGWDRQALSASACGLGRG
jgi:hypothetical protein